MSSDVSPPFTPVHGEDDHYALGEDSPFELLAGRLVVRRSSYRREDLAGFLNVLFRGWLEEHSGGVALGSRYPMRLDAQWSPEPDLLVVRTVHRDRLTEKRLEGPADLVIEIASDGDPRFDEREKRPCYHEARVPEMWWISPQAGTVLVDQLDGDGYRTQRLAQGRICSVALPGFWVETGWLWQTPLPSTMACLQQLLA